VVPGGTEADLTGWRKGDPAKVKLVTAVRIRTNLSPAWIGQHRFVGSLRHVSNLSGAHCKRERLKS